ncbi:MAG: bifunctional riboflavin kinase/FAD synthetase [Anaerolineae bacterium]|nr:bifunctional riboflavin kinase/FAD synthetase [Anaerolineae bacterium]
MQIIEALSDAAIDRPSLVSVGSFDGVHLGHQHLLEAMQRTAQQRGFHSVVITFRPRPQVVLFPERPHYDLTTQEEKCALLAQLGLDITVVLHFTSALAQVSAADFVASLVTHLRMRELWIGPNSAMGRNREGDITRLRQLGREMGFTVHVVEPLICDGEIVSSTRIRQLLQSGQIRRANALLGRYYALSGLVTRGATRGKQLGFPTANIAVPHGLVMPPRGVYAGFACIEGQRWPAVANIGIRPTFSEQQLTVEAHLLGFSGDLYDRLLRLELVDFLRAERQFGSADALAAQIREDAALAAQLLEREGVPVRCAPVTLRVAQLLPDCDPLHSPSESSSEASETT